MCVSLWILLYDADVGTGIHRLQSVASKGERIRFVLDVEKFIKKDPNYTQVACLTFVISAPAAVDPDIAFPRLASRVRFRQLTTHRVQSTLWYSKPDSSSIHPLSQPGKLAFRERRQTALCLSPAHRHLPSYFSDILQIYLCEANFWFPCLGTSPGNGRVSFIS